MLADDSEGARQPEPSPFTFGLSSEEWLKDCGLNFARDTDSGVANGDVSTDCSSFGLLGSFSSETLWFRGVR